MGNIIKGIDAVEEGRNKSLLFETYDRYRGKITFNGSSMEVSVPVAVDTISEKTSGGGVTVDGLLIKDGKVSATGLADSLGVAPVPVVRTNNPIIGANTVNANIDALDAAIGADADFSAVTRTTGQLTSNSTILTKIDALDAAIGFDNQMSGTPTTVSKNATIYQNLEALGTYKTLRTVKKTIGGIGITADFNFITAANTNEQVIDLGAIVPAKARIVDVFTFTDTVFTGATTLVAETGTTSSGAELIGSATIYATNAITSTANGGVFIAAPSATATNIYVSATPGANWSNVTAGKVSVYVTFIDVTNV